ncbi:HDOD domain-containing protein [Rubrivivax benzoatilyticus]|uniref:HDOD domain-containing protein n=1 Tax=Rubrivivax benzoatilyticus TaxID=316997 RepID=A0ABX0HUZ1_9BURK|nr:HDOD domain-containing protein [Rubrivivax benzoatilyticus]EGJ10626.1 hypothetical protein RBXJA2T_09889 [Rubrivivax benzoatilyticus JA2 = ATCC BAA-35]NHK97333.1 HDOD domain-containing protein [Rubrivivax benzoatilyticus]NHL22972.1 HDOD domain-containing protein [Rubrivivax benzoatilyticus]
MSWLARLFAPRRREATRAAVPVPALRPDAAAPAAAIGQTPPAAPPVPLLCWLLGAEAPAAGPATAAEARALEAIDAVLAQPGLPEDLLPRAAALVPQLLAMLRQGDQLPVPAMAQRVSRDVVLTAEVLKLAGSAYYRGRGEAADLQQSISLIGVQGLQTVIARVVLKPIYDHAPGPWSRSAGARLWAHSEALAAECALRAEGVPVFDAYLTGLLHDSGWTAALNLLDRGGTAPAPPSEAFCAALERRAYRLFGRAARRWAITPAFAELGADTLRHPLATSPHPLAVVLRQAMPAALERARDETA